MEVAVAKRSIILLISSVAAGGRGCFLKSLPKIVIIGSAVLSAVRVGLRPQQSCQDSIHAQLWRGPAKNQMMTPSSGKNSTSAIQIIFQMTSDEL
jgi:hypothetical protein